MQFITQHGGVFLNQMIQGEPGVFIGPISMVLGTIINAIYFVVSSITPVGALGFSIIIMTIVVRSALLPSGFRMQRNTMKMREMKPEQDKIREKYGDTKDPELRRKMQAELQALQAKHGVNMFATCLPMLITWPLFIGLFAVLGQAFLFVGSVGDAYSALSSSLIAQGSEFLYNVIANMAVARTPQGMVIDLQNITDMNRLVHVFNAENWDIIFANLSGPALAEVQQLHNDVVSIQSFFGLNLVVASGTSWPGIMLPILSAGTMALSQFLMTRNNADADPNQKMIQKVMMIVFPLMFGWFTIGAPAGVGLYWVMMNIYLIGQHYFISKYYAKKDEKAKTKAA